MTPAGFCSYDLPGSGRQRQVPCSQDRLVTLLLQPLNGVAGATPQKHESGGWGNAPEATRTIVALPAR